MTPGISVVGKAIANRLGLPLYQITGFTNYGRVRLYCMGFLQAENVESLKWMLMQLKKFVTPSNGVALTPELVASV